DVDDRVEALRLRVETDAPDFFECRVSLDGLDRLQRARRQIAEVVRIAGEQGPELRALVRHFCGFADQFGGRALTFLCHLWYLGTSFRDTSGLPLAERDITASCRLVDRRGASAWGGRSRSY